MATKKQRTGMNMGLMALMGLVGILAVGTVSVRAEAIGDIPISLGNTLGIDPTTAGIILVGMAIISISLAMAVAKQPVIPTSITLIAAIGMFTALGWVDAWLLILACLAFVTMFTKKVADTFTGGGKGAD